MGLNFRPMPMQADLIESPKNLKITETWQWFLRDIVDRLQSAPSAAASAIHLTNQSASIGLTALVTVTSAGLFRVSWSARLTQAATISSSLQIDFSATDGGVTAGYPGTAYTGNDVSRPFGGVVVIKSDASAPIQFQATYATSGATPMKFDLDFVIEAL